MRRRRGKQPSRAVAGGRDRPAGATGAVGLALAAAALFGGSTPLAKTLLGELPPQSLAGLLYLGSGIGLGALWIARRVLGLGSEQPPLTRTDLPWLAGAVACGGVVAPVLLLVALARSEASSTALLLNFEGVLTALLAGAFFGENIGPRIAAGMVAITAGGVVLAWQGSPTGSDLTGPLLAVAACLAWAVDNNLTQKIAGADAIQTAAVKGVVAGSVNLAIAAAIGAQASVGLYWLAALALGLAGYGASLVCYLRALGSLGTARTGAYFAVAPFAGAALAIPVLGEPVTVTLAISAALMGLGVWLHVGESHVHAHSHEALVHVHAHVHDEHHREGHRHLPGDPPVTDPKAHVHLHRHVPIEHEHAHYPDLHHRHGP